MDVHPCSSTPKWIGSAPWLPQPRNFLLEVLLCADLLRLKSSLGGEEAVQELPVALGQVPVASEPANPPQKEGDSSGHGDGWLPCFMFTLLRSQY